jgi:galactokinase
MFHSSAPARVCLFGEHQDYLELKVIPAAINLRLDIRSNKMEEKGISIFSQELNEHSRIRTDINRLEAKKGSLTSYLEAGILALKRYKQEIIIPPIEVTINSQIPIASGLSSSAALLVAWIKQLCGIINLDLDKRMIAELAYDAEHNVLSIPCGRMDQYASSFGGIFSLDCTDKPKLLRLKSPEIGLIVVDSQTPKLTSSVHGEKVSLIKQIVNRFEKDYMKNLEEINLEFLKKQHSKMKQSEFSILEGVIAIKENTLLAEKELSKNTPDIEHLGQLLTSQQSFLKNNIKVSLPVLDKIVRTGIDSGALGGKLTGAGLGGSVVLLTNEDDDKTFKKIQNNLNLPAYSVKIDEGADFKKT